MVEFPVCLTNGNVLESVIMAAIVFIAKTYMASYWSETFTQIAANVGFGAAVNALAGGTFVIGYIMSNCTAGLITMAFLTMNPIIIAIPVVLYVVFFVFFKKNKFRMQEGLEKIALGDAYKAPVVE